MAKITINLPDYAVDRIAEAIAVSSRVKIPVNKTSFIYFYVIRMLANLASSFETIKKGGE